MGQRYNEIVGIVVDGYIRVSQVAGRGGENFISPSVQREQIEVWAKLNRAALGRVFEELDESGARSDRPMLMEAIERVERGETQGIVVAKLDRFGRSLVDGLANIERISNAGGTFVSVQDGLDLGTPTGKLVLRIMFSMAEWELDRVRANWDVAQERAVARGVHPVAFVPLGYTRGQDRRLKIDPGTAPLVIELFRRRADGAPMAELMEFLNDSGTRTIRGGKHFIPSSVAGIIRNRVYLGEAAFGRHLNPRAHPPLVDTATWHDAQRPRKKRGKRRTSLLVSVLRCGTCRLSMATWDTVTKEAKAIAYRCPTHSSAGRCPGPASVMGEDIEPLVEEFVFRAVRSSGQTRQGVGSRIARLEDSLSEAQGSVSRYRDNVSLSDRLDPESFAAGVAKRQVIVERIALELAGAMRAAKTPNLPSANEIEAVWPSLSIRDRRAIIEEFVDCVFIVRGKEPAIERAYVCRRGDAPFDVPRAGVPIGSIRSFDRHRSNAVRLRPPRQWSERRIEKELRQFLGDRNDWPRYVEFAIAGRARLHYQVMNWGGPYFWAHRLGLALRARAVQWNEPRIRGALRAFLRRRTTWPTGAEFNAAGLNSLHTAVKRHRGIALWAEEFDLPYLGATRPLYWTFDRIEAELNVFVAGLDAYPSPSYFLKAGREDLYGAINRNGGHKLWAGKIGLTRG
jgi:DNA invertase Pin-like site-specific DNA recombinase